MPVVNARSPPAEPPDTSRSASWLSKSFCISKGSKGNVHTTRRGRGVHTLGGCVYLVTHGAQPQTPVTVNHQIAHVFFRPFCHEDCGCASPLLAQLCAQDSAVDEVILELVLNTDGGYERFLRYTLNYCYITSISQSGSDGGGYPTESISICYDRIEWQYLAGAEPTSSS
jgi:hypothetical protein